MALSCLGPVYREQFLGIAVLGVVGVWGSSDAFGRRLRGFRSALGSFLEWF